MHTLRRTLTGWRWVALAALLAAVAWLALHGLPDGRLHVYFLDVGQGDAILVRAPDGRQILIDGGPSPAALLGELGEILPFWGRSLDMVILTHPDADHITGLMPLLDAYRVRQVLDTPASDAASVSVPWREELTALGVTRRFAGRGMALVVGDLRITILHPRSAPRADGDAGDNDNSIVLRLDYDGNSLLLTGDAGVKVEAELIAADLPLRADVLKVGHHGSRSSTSAAFVAAVDPSLAVIQVGADNDFGHPNPEVLERLEGAKVLRTDEDGRIEVIGDGSRIWFRAERNR